MDHRCAGGAPDTSEGHEFQDGIAKYAEGVSTYELGGRCALIRSLIDELIRVFSVPQHSAGAGCSSMGKARRRSPLDNFTRGARYLLVDRLDRIDVINSLHAR